jgi:hypothetical protein
MLAWLAFGLVIVHSSGNGQGADRAIYGAGNVSCGAWTGSARSGDRAAFLSWVHGFITGVGSIADLKLTDTDAMEQWMNKYCAEHPLATLDGATAVLADELKR